MYAHLDVHQSLSGSNWSLYTRQTQSMCKGYVKPLCKSFTLAGILQRGLHL